MDSRIIPEVMSVFMSSSLELFLFLHYMELPIPIIPHQQHRCANQNANTSNQSYGILGELFNFSES